MFPDDPAASTAPIPSALNSGSLLHLHSPLAHPAPRSRPCAFDTQSLSAFGSWSFHRVPVPEPRPAEGARADALKVTLTAIRQNLEVFTGNQLRHFEITRMGLKD